MSCRWRLALWPHSLGSIRSGYFSLTQYTVLLNRPHTALDLSSTIACLSRLGIDVNQSIFDTLTSPHQLSHTHKKRSPIHPPWRVNYFYLFHLLYGPGGLKGVWWDAKDKPFDVIKASHTKADMTEQFFSNVNRVTWPSQVLRYE